MERVHRSGYGVVLVAFALGDEQQLALFLSLRCFGFQGQDFIK